MTNQERKELRQKRVEITEEFKIASEAVLENPEEDNKALMKRRQEINDEIYQIDKELRELT